MTSLSATVRQHSTFQSLIRHQKSTNKPKQIYKIPYNSLDILLWLLEYLRIFSMLYIYLFICKFGRLKLAMNKKKIKENKMCIKLYCLQIFLLLMLKYAVTEIRKPSTLFPNNIQAMKSLINSSLHR